MKIGDLKNALKYRFLKDSVGTTVYPGDILFDAFPRSNILSTTVNEVGEKKVTLDLSSYEKVKESVWRHTYFFVENGDSIFSYPYLSIAEYFIVGGKPTLFFHSYIGLNFRLWRAENPDLEDLINVGSPSLSNINVKYSASLFKDFHLNFENFGIGERIKRTLQSEKTLKEKDDVVTISLKDMKAAPWIEKIERGIRIRGSWTAKTDRLPELVMEFNNDGINRFEEINPRLNLFYAAGEKKSMKIYCKHPYKDHIETFYSFNA